MHRNNHSPRPAYKWALVAMLWFVCFFNYADRQAIFSVFPKLKEEFGFTKTQLGLIASAFMWVYAFGAPFAGHIADRCSRKHLILGGCIFWSAVTALTGRCAQLWQFVTVRALEGVGETFYFPASMSLLAAHHGERTRSRAFSLHQSSVYIGSIGGSWVGALMAERYGWRSGFYFFGAAGLALACVLYFFVREPARENLRATETAPLLSSWREVIRQPGARMLMFVFVGANAVATVFLTWTPTFLVEKFGFKLSAAGLSGSVFIHLASACSVPFGGWLADRLSMRRAGGRMLVQAIGLGIGAGFVALIGLTRDVTTLLIAMTCFGLCKGLYDANIFASLYDVVPANLRGSAAGLMNTAGWGGGALGPLAVGWVASHGRHATEMANMSEAIACGGVIYLIGAFALATAAYRRERLLG